MTKTALFKLGKLVALKEELHNRWVDSGYTNNDVFQKRRLIQVVSKGLEEVSRGKLKSKVPYGEMADFLVNNVESSDYASLYLKVTAISLQR